MPSTRIEIIQVRESARFRRLQRLMRRQAEDNLDVCTLCGHEIDYQAEPRSPESWSLDHIISMAEDLSLAYEPDNLASAHLKCNQAKGSGPTWPTAKIVTVEPTSIDWCPGW